MTSDSSDSSSDDDSSSNNTDNGLSSFLGPSQLLTTTIATTTAVLADKTHVSKAKAAATTTSTLSKATTTKTRKKEIVNNTKKGKKSVPRLFSLKCFSKSKLVGASNVALLKGDGDGAVLQSIYVAFSAASYAVLRALYRANKREEDDLLLPDLDLIIQTCILQDKPHIIVKNYDDDDDDHSTTSTETDNTSTHHQQPQHSSANSSTTSTATNTNTNDDTSTSTDDSGAPISALSTKQRNKRHEKLKTNMTTTTTSAPTFEHQQQPPKYISIEQQQDQQDDATIDPRTLMTRAILCSAASITFSTITPFFQKEVNPLDIPQNNNTAKLNMGAVILQSSTLGKRILSHVALTSSRAKKRHEFIIDNLNDKRMKHTILAIPNPFAWSFDTNNKDTNNATTTNNSYSLQDQNTMSALAIQHLQNDRILPNTTTTNDHIWKAICKPRFLQVLNSHPSPLMINGTNANNTTNDSTSTTNNNGGHVIYHDMDWNGRAHKIADILVTMAAAASNTNFGPHLIICTSDQIPTWEMAFSGLGCFSSSLPLLRALSYTGTKRQLVQILPYLHATVRGSMSNSNICTSTYLSDAPWHVLLTSYKIFIKDFVHLCQIPWQVVVLDDGMSWLGTAHGDPNGKIGRAWDAVWSKSDGWAGLAGLPPYFGGRGDIWSCEYNNTNNYNNRDEEAELESDSILSDGDEDQYSDTNNSTDGETPTTTKMTRKSSLKTTQKPPSSSSRAALAGTTYLLGLTARHRILTCSHMSAAFKGIIYPAPVASLIQFVCPQYMDITKEEWDRSRMSSCVKSTRHVRSLVARAVIVHPNISTNGDDVAISAAENQVQLAWDAMEGVSPFSEVLDNGGFQAVSAADFSSDLLNVSIEKLVSSGKITQSRRFATAWLSPSMRQEIGSMCHLDHILGAVYHASESTGYVCEEIVSTGTAGAAGDGNMYGCAVRCGRIFTNEQGLRQHLAAMHAPPGTWLCRSCGADCGTSLARTHHERYCAAAGGSGGTSGATPTVGQGASNNNMKQYGPGVGKQGNTSGNVNYTVDETVDKDGALLVPTYRGVWVNTDGKYFIKIDGKTVMNVEEEKSSTAHLFLSAEEAANHYDTTMKNNSDGNVELNFKKDGSRIIYEDSGTMTNVSRSLDALGGGAISVVPALSVINIKDLPDNVKPLLRDPRQASRAGANSKRFIYKYRGVCRQARKGHDRWQSQISFGGTNHYLGTFDSEWDAAAIYAWAHLILYGEEATKKAEKEGEEAVAIWEQEQKDIAEGKVVEKDKPNKKIQPMVKKAGTGIKAEGKPKLPGRRTPVKKDVDTTKSNAGSKRKASSPKLPAPVPKGAYFMLLGINSTDFSWTPDNFLLMCGDSLNNIVAISSLLKVQFGPEGENTSFKEMVSILPIILGAKGGGKHKGTFVDCDVRGPIRTCSSSAARIEYSSIDGKGFQLSCSNEDDIVTLNSRQITKDVGSCLIKSGDICSVGARVFLFLVPVI